MATELNDCVADGLRAATPPLEGLRMLVSDAATLGPEDAGQKKSLMINDVSRAFFGGSDDEKSVYRTASRRRSSEFQEGGEEVHGKLLAH